MNPIRYALAALALAVLLATDVGAADGHGRIRGKVIDEYNAITLPGAPVEVVGTDTVVYTDMDGAFDVSLAPGSYDIRVVFSGYKESLHHGVPVATGQTTTLDVVLATPTVALTEEITVTAEAGPAATSQAAALLERKKAGTVSDSLAREEMSANSDSDAAAAMTRVTGVSVVGGEYIYVRGLGERYSNTTLNGTVLPTTEPDKRVVPLDLFPTALLQGVKVTKSYLPDKPAEFSGGLIEIEPINFPEHPILSISFSGGYNSNTTGKNIESYPGGGIDWLGYDDGTRALPSNVPDAKLVERGLFGSQGFTPQQLTEFGRSFANVWEPRSATGKPDTSFSILGGNNWGKLGAVGSVTYNYKNRFREERQQIYALAGGKEATLRPTNDFDFRYSTAQATLGAIANVSYRFSGDHRLALENFYTNSGSDEARRFEGYQEDKGVPLRNSRLYWNQETIFSGKLSGEHFFPGLSNSRLDWRGTYSRARRDEPDLREVLYQFNPAVDGFELANESQSGFRMFNDLTDQVYEGAADWTTLFSGGGRSSLVKIGGVYTHRTRDFLSRRLRFKPTRSAVLDLTLPPETLLRDENVGVDFQLEEDTRTTDKYDATHDIYAGYGMVDLPITNALRFVGGARVEYSDQEVLTRDPFDPTVGIVPASLSNTDVLPGLNLVYQLAPDMNLRGAWSLTVNRPEFRELAPFEFTDIVGGRAVVGNPDLVRAKIMNADLRWEWFPASGGADGEVVAASLFWKDFTDPIERVVEATAAFRTSYANAKGARNLGFELEARKSFGPHLLLGANYTYVDSKIALERGIAQIQTNLDRPLAGQSPNVLNGMLELRNGRHDLSVRVLVNYFDNRISDVGVLGAPDILENGRTTLDAVVTRSFGTWSLRLTGDNLTNAEILFTQGGLFQRGYKSGRSISLGVSYSR